MRTPKQGLSHPQCCSSDDGSASVQASKHKWETAYNPFLTMNHSQPYKFQLYLPCFSAFLLEFTWFTRNDLAQGIPNVFVWGPNEVIQNMSRARPLTYRDCFGVCYILPNQQLFVNILFFISDKCYTQAVVWRPWSSPFATHFAVACRFR